MRMLHGLAAAGGLGALLALGGCAALAPPTGAGAAQLGGPAGQPAEAALQDASVTVEIRPQGGRVERHQVPYQPGMVLGDAVGQTGAAESFRQMDIELVRRAPGGQARLRMKAKFHPQSRRIDPSTDYALRPGDHVLVTDTSVSLLEETTKRLLGPFAGG